MSVSVRIAVIVGCVTSAFGLTAGTASARTRIPETLPSVLHHRLASALFRTAGIRWISSGHCSRRTNPRCTSFEGLRSATLGGLLELRDGSNCRVVLSGGTEVGHARLRHGHGHGYKLDLVPNRCLDRYVRRHFTRIRTRGDGARQWRAPGLGTFAREPSHWDVTFA